MNYNRQILRDRMIDAIIENVLSDSSGKGLDYIETRPSQIFFVGDISPKPKPGEFEKVATKLSPNSMGIEILLPHDIPKEACITISPSGAFYYRVFPSYEKQKEYSDKISPEHNKPIDFLEKFKKMPFSVEFSKNVWEIIEKCEKDGEFIESFDDFCTNMWETAKKDEEFFAPNKKEKSYLKIPVEYMENKNEYEKFINMQKIDIACYWGFDIYVECFRTSNGHRMRIMLVNKMETISQPKIRKIIDNYIFETKILLKSSMPFKVFVLDQLEKNFRHDRTIEATGINCSFRKISGSEIETTHVPIFKQMRKMPRDMGKIRFLDLENDPIPILENLKMAMKEKYEIFKNNFKSIAKTDEEKKELDKDILSIESEIERFENGIKNLKSHSDAMRAFILMNKAFGMSNKDKYDSWYPFQIVFITSLVSDIISERSPEIKNFRDCVDILYFPTGGGKTEAFLGLAVFQAFYDRICGKKFGVSVITKFPLRMLSLDQMHRIAEVFAKAEIVRRGESDINKEDYHPFSVGYFVGDTVTPNKLVDWDEYEGKYKNILEEIEKDKEMLDKYHIFSKCPFCGSDSELIVDKIRIRLSHKCTNKDCIGELPIYITDTEIFRYVPTFIVGTLDKMAILGQQINFRNMLGAISNECNLHGFSSSMECTEKICKADLAPIPKYDYSPSLLIQDEMHLVRDTLGSFDSHYETAISYLIRNFSGNNKRIKIVCATATLSDKTYNEHSNHLYLRNAVKFPATLEVFTEDSKEVGRIMVGVMPHSKSLINSMEEIVASISKTIQSWIVDKSTLKILLRQDYPDDVIEKELRDFWTTLTYHIKKNDAYQISRSVSTRINEKLSNELGLKALTKKTLTGDVNFKEIKQVMSKVSEECRYCESLDLLIATSIISHGVDINALNLMAFMGMPGNNAEYIQALSRVGRKRSGLVFVVFNPTRERDRSYFKYFHKFHQLSDLLIEATPIQRFSKKVVEKTCPGIFCGSIYSYFDFIINGYQKSNGIGQLKFPKNFVEAMTRGLISDLDIINFVRNCYTDGTIVSPQDFEEKINITASECINSILRLDLDSIRRYNIIGNFLSPGPLRNLRDIEDGVSLTLSERSISALRRGIIKGTDFTEGD